jgi:hypothetical protein
LIPLLRQIFKASTSLGTIARRRWRLQTTTRRNEVVLHVHDYHRGLGRFDSFDFRRCLPLLKSDGQKGSKPPLF